MSSLSHAPATSPFSAEASLAFTHFLSQQDLKRRVRPSNEKHTHIPEYLSKTRIAVTQDDHRLKFKAFREYEVLNGRLYTKLGHGSKASLGQRNVPRDEEVFDIISCAHIGLLHPGQDKTFYEIERTTVGISRKEVTELLKHCLTCAKKGSQKSKAPVKVIVENMLWGRVQIDLIDMRGDPDGEFKWICHLRDHFSKYSVASPMPNKTSEEVVKVVITWIMYFGPPKILQSDNGTEFKGALTILLRQHGIKIINGRPRHPQSQGMVEKGNHILKEKIGAWQSDHQSSAWVCSLPEVIAGMNAQRSSVTGKSPYEVVFGQVPHGTRVSYLEREVDEVLEEDSTAPAIGFGAFEVAGLDIIISDSDEEPQSMIAEGAIVPTLTSSLRLHLGGHNDGEEGILEVDQALPHYQPARGSAAEHLVATAVIRHDAQAMSARSHQQMVDRDAQRNPPAIYPIGTLATLRIPKKNRTTAQNRRLLCRILAEVTPGRYRLETEYGTLKNTYPSSELDSISQTVDFNPKAAPAGKNITLNFASRQERVLVSVPVLPQGDGLKNFQGLPLPTIPIRPGSETVSDTALEPFSIFVLSTNMFINRIDLLQLPW